jgi:hypothetical protein
MFSFSNALTTARYIWFFPTAATTSNRKGEEVATESVLSNTFSPKRCPRRQIGDATFWPESALLCMAVLPVSASSHLLSELLCFTPPTTATSAHLPPCSNSPVANNKSKDTGRCSLLRVTPHSGIARDCNLTPRHLSAPFVTALTKVARPGDSLLQQASAGQPNQPEQRRLPE